MSLSALLLDDDPARAAIVEPALREAGYAEITVVQSALAMLKTAQTQRPSVIIIDRDTPDRDTLEHVCRIMRDMPIPIVMFTNDTEWTLMRAALESGVSAYVVDGFSSKRLRPILEVAQVRFEQWQGLHRKLEEAQTNLEERKVIERAKGIVMKQRGCTEDGAYRALRKMAMDRGKRLVNVAEALVAADELLS